MDVLYFSFFNSNKYFPEISIDYDVFIANMFSFFNIDEFINEFFLISKDYLIKFNFPM